MTAINDKLGSRRMFRIFRRPRRAVLVLSVAGVLAGAMASVSAIPALAYGKATWQITFSGTATSPGTANGQGFWGWCDFAGGATTGATSGSSGDCEESEYVHALGGAGFTCEVSLDITAWEIGTGQFGPSFFITGTATVHPSRPTVTAPCLTYYPGSASFGDLDTGIPGIPGHYNFGGIGIPGAVGELQITVTEIP